MKKIFWLLAIVFCFFQSNISAQNLTSDSYKKAREVLDKSVAAYGGLENLRSIENVSFRVEGDTIHRNQSRKTFLAERTPYNAEFVIDVKNSRYKQSQKGGYPGGFSWHNGFIINKTDGVTFDLIRGSMREIPNIPPSAIRQRLGWMPQFVVLNAVDRASRLRFLGKTQFDKRPHSVVSFSNEDGAEIALYFDEKTNLLSKFETLGTDVFAGDVVSETIFTGYRKEGGRQIPTGRITKTNDEMTGEMRFLDVAFNAALTDEIFNPPDGMKPFTMPANTNPVSKIAENVYTVVAGGYNVLVVDFKDYIFVMEAPGGDNVSRQAIEQIRKTISNKPIKYVAVTHHHDDHAGGIRTYIAAGATVIAAPGEKTFFEKVAQSRFTIEPDSLTRNPQPLKIETIQNGKRVLTDGTTTVEILDIGSGPHTEEMLVAYLPNEKILFQGDLLNNPTNGDAAIANDTTAHFAKWVESKKLAVDKIVPVHGTVQTLEELRQAVAKMPAAKTSAKN